MADVRADGGKYATAVPAQDSGGGGQARLVAKTSIPVAVAYCDPETCYRFVNGHYADRYGLAAEQVVGRRVREVVGDGAWAKCEAHIRAALAGQAIEFDLDLSTGGGEPQFERVRYEPEWRDGAVTGVIATMTPITELTRAEQYFRASETTFRQLVENSPFGIYAVDADLRIVHLSAGAIKAFNHGLLVGRDVGEALRQIWPEPFASEVLQRFRTTLDTGEPYRARATVAQRADTGVVESYDWQLERLIMPDGRAGVVAHFYDLSERQRYESSLRASAASFRKVVENSPFGVYAVDADFRIIYMSAVAVKAFNNYRMVGWDIGDALRRVWPEPFASDLIRLFRNTMATGEPYRAPAAAERRADTGVVETYDWQMERLIMPDGRAGVVVHFYDLSERQRYESSLRASEMRFRVMFDASSVGKIEIDPETTRFVRVNPAMCELVGYSEAELLERTVLEITHPDERARDADLGRRLADGVSESFDVEKRYLRKDGTIVWARTTVNAVRDAAGRALHHIAVIQDLTAQKQAERELEASKDRLQLALNAALLGWWQYDPVAGVVSGDERFRAIFDVSAEATAAAEIVKRVLPDDAAASWAAFETALDPATQGRSTVQFRLRHRDGEVRWVEAFGLTHFEGSGAGRRAVSVVGTAQDVTERKEREAKEQLLLREVNHRSKNMLSVVNVIARQTAAKTPDDFMERFSARIQALSANQDLLIRNEWERVGIEELVCAQLTYFHDLIGSRIVLTGDEVRLNAASAQSLGLALHELATNAGKYGALSTDAGRVEIGWRIAGDTFTMRWSERDGPPVSTPKRRGFGTAIVEAMMACSVDGSVDLDYAPAGLVWRLTCPAASILDPWDRNRSPGRVDG